NISALYGWDYAHRGLFDKEKRVPENSLLAFQRAIVQGYGIEMDIQRTKDQVLVVFHDDDLQRMCGVEGLVKDYTYEELKTYTLYGSDENIPTFEQVLKLVAGRVPLIIEIKSAGKASKEVAEQTYDVLQNYKGGYCVESFDPRVLQWYKKKAPQVIRGQLALGNKGNNNFFLFVGLKYLLVNVLSRPDFIAYQYEYDRNVAMWIMENFFKVPLVAWTVKSKKEYLKVKEKYSLQIFEGFLPKN
ncbi:MAG: glycerophosphodiester phosphodiesterase, partial [Clostridiales bacterium]|nr:glycerophosphodiester phosphodiesterase [Clostridiales bacterium]